MKRVNMSSELVIATCGSCGNELKEKYTFVYAQVIDTAISKRLVDETVCLDCAIKYKRKLELFLATEEHLSSASTAVINSSDEDIAADPSSQQTESSEDISENTDIGQETTRTFEEWLQKLLAEKAKVRVLDQNNFVHEGTLLLVDRRGIILADKHEQLFIPFERIASITKTAPKRN